MLIGISALIMSFLFLVTARTTGSVYQMNRVKAFYISEAGINKAIWCLSFGSMGSTYRTGSSIEAFGGGSYNYSILDGPLSSIIITSTGEVNGVSRTIQQLIISSALPPAFDFAVYGNGNLSLQGNSSIKGPVFSNGNISIKGNTNHPTGETSVSPGHTVTVNGKPVPFTVIDPPPPPPTMNTKYYDDLITAAGTSAAGNRTIGSTNLNGNTIFVNGNVTISGNSTLTGGGIIVATGTINISGNTTIGPNTKFISNKTMTITGNTNIQDDGVLYSNTTITDSGNNRLKGAIMAPSITINGNDTIYGFLYSWGVSVALNGNINMYGAIVNPSAATYTGNIKIEYDPSYLPEAPIGLTSGGYTLLKGSWKEL